VIDFSFLLVNIQPVQWRLSLWHLSSSPS